MLHVLLFSLQETKLAIQQSVHMMTWTLPLFPVLSHQSRSQLIPKLLQLPIKTEDLMTMDSGIKLPTQSTGIPLSKGHHLSARLPVVLPHQSQYLMMLFILVCRLVPHTQYLVLGFQMVIGPIHWSTDLKIQYMGV